MTEPEDRAPDWTPLLSAIARASGHELRNALNALVVNLEVVRARTSDVEVEPFVRQSVIQSEESARLAEAVIALLDLMAGAVGASGEFRAARTASGGVAIAREAVEIDRTVRALGVLAERGAIGVGTSDSAVILTIPD